MWKSGILLSCPKERKKKKVHILKLFQIFNKNFKKRKSYSRISVSEDHKHQATCYSLSFNINRVIFIYENRDFCLKKAFLFTITDKLKAEVVGMINSCNDYVSKNELPIKIVCKFCNYCDYKNKCAKDEV